MDKDKGGSVMGAKEDLTYTVTATGYTIYLKGTPWIVQEGFIPYPSATIAEAAQNHIDQILAEQAAAEAAANQPSETDILGMQIVQMQLDIAALKGGVA